MAAKKKIDGRTKEGRALLAKAAEKALKAKKLGKKSVKAKKQVTYPARKALKKAGRPTLAAHVKLAKTLTAGTIIAVKSRDGIVGEVAHYIEDSKKAVIRRGVEGFAETQVIIQTTKLRAATQFEALAYVEMVELIETLQEQGLKKKIEAAVEVIENNATFDPAFNVVESAGEQQPLSDEEAIRVVEEVLKASQDDIVFSEA